MTTHKNKEGVYVPPTGINYPEVPDEPILTPKILRNIILDENYPYLDKSFGARFRHIGIYLGIFCLVFPIQKIRSTNDSWSFLCLTPIKKRVKKLFPFRPDEQLQ